MQSMTGYGSCLVSREDREMLIELKAVNHRFLDCSFRLPRGLMFLEDALRGRMAVSGISRGHVDVFVTYQNNRADSHAVKLDLPLVRACGEACLQARKSLPPEIREPSVAEILTLCGALSVQEGQEDREQVTALAEEAFAGAARQLLEMRGREGEALRADLADNLSQLDAKVQSIARRAPAVPLHYRERLQSRLQEWQITAVDPQRMAQEVATMADRYAIDEELSRLQSHMAQFGQGLESREEIGRRLDFLLQEMNREVNTIGSKASDAQIAQDVVDAKCLLEKLREQAQNVV